MRVQTKVGDIFSVSINEKEKKYFQYLTNDLTQLNSDVICAFKTAYPLDLVPDLAAIAAGEVEFYAHCIVKLGLKQNAWEKVNNTKIVADYSRVLFRSSGDFGNPAIKISENWWVWKISEPQLRVGKLEGENTKAEIGLVMNPENIIHRLKTGVYSQGGYPGF